MRVLFMGSGPFGLPALRRLAVLEKGRLAVATVPDAPQGRRGRPVPTPVKKCAVELGLQCFEVETLKGEVGSRLLRDSGAELVIVADFRLMLTSRFLAGPARKCYNLHGSVLPRWRGAAPVARGVLFGDTEFGVTLYQMVRALDAGPIVAVSSFRPEGLPDAPVIEADLSAMAADLAVEWLDTLKTGQVPLREQDESKVTLAPKLTKTEGWIGWHATASVIANQVRALKPWPRTFARLEGRHTREDRLFVDAVTPLEAPGAPEGLSPGTVAEASATTVLVACGSAGTGRIALDALQRPGRRSLPIGEFLRGNPLSAGDRFLGPESPSS